MRQSALIYGLPSFPIGGGEGREHDCYNDAVYLTHLCFSAGIAVGPNE